MFVLLKKLQQIKADAATGAPFRRTSLALRHVDAGSCNGCEHELQNVSGPHYDLARFGLSLVASPRHADVLLITGPVTRRMVEPLKLAYEAMPEPRMVAALGDCALGCNVLGLSSEFVGSVERILPVDIRIPGCPPTPAAIAAAIFGAAAPSSDA
jgi:Ni,Fe-hydrogenase III small subunit